MKRKSLLKIIIFITIIISIITMIILIMKKTNKIKIVENIKSTINKQSEINENITTIDVTNLETGSNINHQHIFKTNYNSTEHWNECTICHEKIDITSHSVTTTWALGYESCEMSNSYTKICTCGYLETGHKPCVWNGYSYIEHIGYKHFDNDGSNIIDEYSRTHTRKCSVCNYQIQFCYYMNQYGSGKIYDVTLGLHGTYAEYCRKSDGSRITCNNPGTCAKCGMTQNAHSEFYVDVASGKYGCWACNEIWGEVEYKNIIDENVPTLNTMIFNFKLYDPWTFSSFRNGGATTVVAHELYETYKQELTSVSNDKKNFTITISVKLKSSVKTKQYIESYFTLNGTRVFVEGAYAYQDRIKPEIAEISSGDKSLTEWSKNKPITIKGTENYCNNINVKIVEAGNEENVIFEGGANVINQKFEISCTPELEASTQGKKYKVIVTDTCENSTEKEFEIAKVDAIPPEITSGERIGTEWAKQKLFDFTALDSGIGEVQIAFNDENKYELATANGNEFSRSYKFIGDVYSPKQAIVLYKDGLGNISSKEVTIDKLDNTAPTITNARIHNNNLLITANDIKEGLGEGSGVSKYRYITSTERLTNPEITDIALEVNSNENIIIENISQVKYIYVVAEDLVGNISEIYEVEVPQLILTSKVNLKAADGKGGIELDWSDYDLADKYFVIYRKQEDASEWEKIVSLEDRLTGGKYTDILGNDKTNPSVPIINIEGKQENNIEITTLSADTGTNYTYYIESYDITDMSILSTSNTIAI